MVINETYPKKADHRLDTTNQAIVDSILLPTVSDTQRRVDGDGTYLKWRHGNDEHGKHTFPVG